MTALQKDSAERSGANGDLPGGQEGVRAEASRKKRVVLCLCDGGADVGFGHISRCLALAEAFEECGWSAIFAGHFADGAEELVARAGFSLIGRALPTGTEVPGAALEMCQEVGADAAVLDSYAVGAEYVRVFARGIPVLLVDDYGTLAADAYAQAAVLSPAILSNAHRYPAARLCLSGSQYVPFRRALRRRRPPQPAIRPQVVHVLVTLGGSDALNVTQSVVQALAEVAPWADVIAVVGRGYSWNAQLEFQLKRCGPGSRLLVQVPDLAGELSGADLCICGGGMTKFEAAYMGVPALVVSLNESQVDETRLFARLGLVVDLGLGKELCGRALRVAIETVVQDVAKRGQLATCAWKMFSQEPARPIVDAFIADLVYAEQA